jgi:integrase
MRGHITKTSVEALQKGQLLTDDECRGFFARCLPSGVISYGFVYRVRSTGKRRWTGIGLHGAITADQARLEAERLRGAVADRRDPVAERQAARKEAVARITMGELVPAYLAERKSTFRPAVFKRQKAYLESYWKDLHELPIGGIERKDVVATVDKIAGKRGRVAADRARTALSAFLSWAIDKEHRDDNPAQGIAKRGTGATRTRVLSEAELVTVWKACGDSDHDKIVRLLILTGQRKTEMGSLSWPEINLDQQRVELPPERTKNKREHIVPLSAEALAVLASIGRRKGRAFVFGQSGGGFSRWSAGKRDLDKRAKLKTPWTVHDLRRSVITHLHERGIAPPHIVEAIVNHVSGHQAGVAGLYNRATYLQERIKALDAWAKHMRSLIDRSEGRNVVRPAQWSS